MAKCEGCKEIFSSVYLTNGYCSDCLESGKYRDIVLLRIKENEINTIEEKQNESIKEYKKQLSLAQRQSIIISTEYTIDDIEERLDLISAQCIFGLNLIKDIFSFIRDIVGGRVNSLENALNDAVNNTLEDLKDKALKLGGDCVVGVKIEHTYNNANNGSILSVFATGTVVKIKDAKINCYECGKSILKLESSCPYCGAPQN